MMPLVIIEITLEQPVQEKPHTKIKDPILLYV